MFDAGVVEHAGDREVQCSDSFSGVSCAHRVRYVRDDGDGMSARAPVDLGLDGGKLLRVCTTVPRSASFNAVRCPIPEFGPVMTTPSWG
jgi:hypothetical protein